MLAHLFKSEDGNLYDTRRTDWQSHPLRADYARTFTRIDTGAQLRATLRAGGYAWPGGYTIALITADGEVASPVALAKDRRALREALADIRSSFHGRIIGAQIYYEGPMLQCVYTNAPIKSAYGNPEGEDA